MKEIADYEQKLATAKERYLKLQGAVEGLNILQDQQTPEVEINALAERDFLPKLMVVTVPR